MLFVVRKHSLTLKPEDDQQATLLRELRAFQNFIVISFRTLQLGSKISNGLFECWPPEWSEPPNDADVLKNLLTGHLHQYVSDYVYKRWRLIFSKERSCIGNDVDKYTAQTIFLNYCLIALHDRFDDLLRVRRDAIASQAADS